MNKAVIGVGSNIDPEKNIEQVKALIAGRHSLIRTSSFVWTRPLGDIPQPDFLNGALLIETDMERQDLMLWLKDIERTLGRPPGGDRWGPRTMDLDLVVWNGEVVDPDIETRDFLKEAVEEVLS